MKNDVQGRMLLNMYRVKDKKGFTLIETLVTSAVVLMLSSIVVFMVIKGKMIWQSSAARTASRQELQVASWKIAQEIQSSNIGYVTDGSTGNLKAFSFISAYDKNGSFATGSSGAPVWQKYVIYYVPQGTKKLLYKEVYKDFIASPDLLRPLTISELTAYCTGDGKLISPSVTTISLVPQPEKKSAVLTLETEIVNKQGKTDKQSRSMTIYLYNN